MNCGIGGSAAHERHLTEKYAKKPVIVMNYPKAIKAFYMRVNDDGRTVAAMDVLAPGIGEIIGGSQREEIGVAGDDQIGMAVDGQLQKFVVLRITTGSDSVGDRDQLGRRQQFTQPISKARRDQRRKTRAGQSDE